MYTYIKGLHKLSRKSENEQVNEFKKIQKVIKTIKSKTLGHLVRETKNKMIQEFCEQLKIFLESNDTQMLLQFETEKSLQKECAKEFEKFIKSFDGSTKLMSKISNMYMLNTLTTRHIENSENNNNSENNDNSKNENSKASDYSSNYCSHYLQNNWQTLSWYKQREHVSIKRTDLACTITVGKMKGILAEAGDSGSLISCKINLADDSSNIGLNTRGRYGSSDANQMDHKIMSKRYLFTSEINGFKYGVWLTHEQVNQGYHEVLHNIALKIVDCCKLYPIEEEQRKYDHKRKLFQKEKQEYNENENNVKNSKRRRDIKVSVRNRDRQKRRELKAKNLFNTSPTNKCDKVDNIINFQPMVIIYGIADYSDNNKPLPEVHRTVSELLHLCQEANIVPFQGAKFNETDGTISAYLCYEKRPRLAMTARDIRFSSSVVVNIGERLMIDIYFISINGHGKKGK